ncbi:MAG: DUF5105 domain-containing protein [Erysipelotrichaceae bacterium]|nr:DUF5105 domain-containing protein [Erysipelotrichaceae bacterium]
MKRKLNILLVLILLLVISGCSTKKPSSIVDEYMKGLQDNITSILNEDAEIAEGDETLYNAFIDAMKQFEYEIVDETVDGDTAVVNVKIKTYSLGLSFANAFTEYLSQAISLAFSGASEEAIQSLMYQIWAEKIAEEVEKGKLYTETVPIELEKVDKNWKIKNDKDENLINALTGNLRNIIESMNQE